MNISPVIQWIEFEGCRHGLLFNQHTFKAVAEQNGLTEAELAHQVSSPGKAKLRIVIDILFAAAVQFCQHNGKLVDFKESDVAQWMDANGTPFQWAKTFEESFESILSIYKTTDN